MEKKNGKGKELAYMGNILFEGEYLNGKINGKGKEYYDDGKLKFEGNYLNGCRHGEGIQYYNNDKVRFEGEYLNDRIWNGKIYDLYSKKYFEIKNGAGYIRNYDYTGKILVSEGNYYNGERHGQQKNYYENGIIQFEGQYVNGSPNGHGKKYEMNGQLRFEGEYINGIAWNGIQYDYDNNTTYNIRNGKYVNNEEENENENENNEQNDDVISVNKSVLEKNNDNIIKEYDPDGNLLFEGEYLYSHRRKGKEYHNGILEYEGEYLYDKKYNGKGFNENGDIIYELKNGYGKVNEYGKNGNLFIGEYLNGKKNGEGKEYSNGKLEYEGNFLFGQRNGKGKLYNTYYDKLLFEGEFLNGKIWSGKGIEIHYYGMTGVSV